MAQEPVLGRKEEKMGILTQAATSRAQGGLREGQGPAMGRPLWPSLFRAWLSEHQLSLSLNETLVMVRGHLTNRSCVCCVHVSCMCM